LEKFLDKDNRVWRIDLCIGNVFHVRDGSQGKFNLLDPTHDVGGQPLQIVLATDLGEFWEMLWLLMEPQAKRDAVTAEQFGLAMAADCLVDAQAKFFDEWRVFFLSLHRPDAALSVESQAKMLATAVKLVTAKIQQINQPQLQQQMEAKVAQAVNAAYGNVRASLDAILGPTPGDSST
jgi:hypothetical protein